jgi:ABC-type antimicrobial peptide transport system permease subunit
VALRHDRPSADAGFDLYLSVRQFTSNWNHVVVRTSVDPQSVVGPVQRIVSALDPNQPVYDFKTMRQRVADAEWTRGVTAALLGAGASTGLILSAVGVYGVVAYLVGRRRREFGVRMALGATADDVRRGVVRDGLVMALPGIAGGLALALLGVRLLGRMVYGVETYDVVSFVAAPIVLLAIVVAASWVPALRSTRLSPTEALRSD